jgi:hypothetical protein
VIFGNALVLIMRGPHESPPVTLTEWVPLWDCIVSTAIAYGLDPLHPFSLRMVHRLLLGCAPAVSDSKPSQSGRVAQPPCWPPPVPPVPADEELVVEPVLLVVVVVLPDDGAVVVWPEAPPVPPVPPAVVLPVEEVPHATTRQSEAPTPTHKPACRLVDLPMIRVSITVRHRGVPTIDGLDV